MTILTILVSPSVVSDAAALCAGIAGEPGAGMFIVTLSGEIENAVQYHLSSGHISTGFAALLPRDEWSGSGYVRTNTGNAAAVKSLSDSAGMSYTSSQVQAIFDGAIVVDGGDWRAVAGNLGVNKV